MRRRDRLTHVAEQSFVTSADCDEGLLRFGERQLVRAASPARSPEELLEFSLAADEPEAILRVWVAYPQVRHDDPLPGGARNGSPLPEREWLGRALAISDFVSDREFRHRGLYAEVCKPLGVRAVMKVFLPTCGATGASFVFDTTRSRFTDSDRLTLQRLVPHLIQLRRNAHARRTYPALIHSTAAARPARRRPARRRPARTRRPALSRTACPTATTIQARGANTPLQARSP